MIVYHGTGNYALPGFLKEPPHLTKRSYLKEPYFSTTTSITVAKLFATRKRSLEELQNGILGVVLEFELTGDYASVRDPNCMLEEHEIAVFDASNLKLLAVWKLKNRKWTRSKV